MLSGFQYFTGSAASSCFLLSSMSCFWAKLVLAVVAIYLLVGVFPATSTLIPTGNNILL